MLKKRLMKTISAVLILGVMMSSVAFADTKTPEAISEGMTIAERQNDYIAKEGTVSSVEKMDSYYRIEVKAANSDEIDMIYNVKPETYTFSQEENGIVSIDSIKEGMKITAVTSAFAPMTMSIPAQMSEVTAFIIMGDGFVNVSHFDGELINDENSLKLNIGENTNIQNINGAKMMYSAEDLKNKNCIVLYTYSTRSIPAQTTPETVIILNDSQADNGQIDESQSDSEKPENDCLVGLRACAEAKGYTVEWKGNKKPVVLKKGDMTVEVTLGSDQFRFEHRTRDIKALDRMEKLSKPVSIEKGKMMVPQSFIDALE